MVQAAGLDDPACVVRHRSGSVVGYLSTLTCCTERQPNTRIADIELERVYDRRMEPIVLPASEVRREHCRGDFDDCIRDRLRQTVGVR